uniref:Potassium voltage-gated channel subfamily KQT member 1-like n=1 Tax=Dermatophagoides pteronyssinus TaxID=6956 RepID=A0A6P6XTL5_DERPT
MMDPNKVNETDESFNDENDSDQQQQDDNFEDEMTTNELTVKSISELTPHRILFSIKPGFPRPKSCGGKLNQLFDTDGKPTGTINDDDDDESNETKSIQTISSSSTLPPPATTTTTVKQPMNRLHSLVQLPEQLDSRTKIHLKMIETVTNKQEIQQQPLNYRSKIYVYNFFNYPNSFWSYGYHLTLAIILIFYLGLVMFTSQTTWEENCFLYRNEHRFKSYFELIIFLHFLIEFWLRFWSSRVKFPYKNLNIKRWIFKYFFYRISHIFDILLVIGGILSATCFIWSKLPIDFTQNLYALIMLRGFHRLFNVLQWTSVQKRDSPWKILIEVFHDGGQLLFAMFYLVLLIIFLVAYGIFLAETNPDHDHNLNDTKINNLMDSIYTTSITLLTVGYGDYSPITYAGQALTGIGIWIALALFAIPSGLIATSVALKITEQEEIRKGKIRKMLATTLIQRAWRFARRQRQYEMVKWLDQMRKTGQESSIPIRTHQILWDKIDHVIENRQQFFATQFIQLLSLNRARRKFRRIIRPDTDPRPAMKSYQVKNSDTIDILENIHQQLEQIIQKQQQTADIDNQTILDFFENKLKQMEQKMIEQNNVLQEL